MNIVMNIKKRRLVFTLLLSYLTIKNISKLVGYNSDHVFRRAFRRVTGVSPSEYKSTAGKKTTI